ncbi:hypothetical protein P4050_30610 [Pseudomonas aeruginosa]|nr:hypothetical protein [Pseudomonas aeruginosa]
MIAEKFPPHRPDLGRSRAQRDQCRQPRRRGGCNTFYVGSKQEMALEYIAACALFARAFNELPRLTSTSRPSGTKGRRKRS